jgi:hypothetical protein
MKLKSRKMIGLGENLEFASSSNLVEHPSILRTPGFGPGVIKSEWPGRSAGKKRVNPNPESLD